MMAGYVAFGDPALDASLASIIGRPNSRGDNDVAAPSIKKPLINKPLIKVPQLHFLPRVSPSIGIAVVASLGAVTLIGLGLQRLGESTPKQQTKIAETRRSADRTSAPSARPMPTPSVSQTSLPLSPVPSAPADDFVEAAPAAPLPRAVAAETRTPTRAASRQVKADRTAAYSAGQSKPDVQAETAAPPEPEPARPVVPVTPQLARAETNAESAPKAPAPPVAQPKAAVEKSNAVPPQVEGRREGIDAIRMLRRQ